MGRKSVVMKGASVGIGAGGGGGGGGVGGAAVVGG